jgi:hypothetical protein
MEEALLSWPLPVQFLPPALTSIKGVHAESAPSFLNSSRNRHRDLSLLKASQPGLGDGRRFDVQPPLTGTAAKEQEELGSAEPAALFVLEQ